MGLSSGNVWTRIIEGMNLAHRISTTADLSDDFNLAIMQTNLNIMKFFSVSVLYLSFIIEKEKKQFVPGHIFNLSFIRSI